MYRFCCFNKERAALSRSLDPVMDAFAHPFVENK